jgi:ABC-type multidrug transport system fused ATPase/permease subunit
MNSIDRIKLFAVSFIQVLLSFFDLIGIGMLGLIGSVTVSAINQTAIAGRTKSVIEFMRIDNYSSQFQVTILALSAVFFMLTKTFISLYLNKKVLFFMSRRGAELSTNLTSNLFEKSFTEIKKQNSQKLIYILTAGMDRITIGVVGGIIGLVADLSLLLILICGLIFVNTQMTLILLFGFTVIAYILYLFIRNKSQELATVSVTYSIDSASQIFEAVGSYRELFLRGQRQTFVEKIGSARMLQAESGAKSGHLMNINKYILEASILIVTLTIAGIQFLLSDALRSVATLTLYFAAISRIAPAIFRLQQNFLTIKSSIGGARPTLDLINSMRLSFDVKNNLKYSMRIATEHNGFIANINLKELKFKYSEVSKFAVSDINLELQTGMYVAIVGPSGAGKSTLIDLMLGLHQPKTGDIQISGLSAINAIEKWPGAVAYVPQEIQLVSGSIVDNVLLGFKDDEFNRKLVSSALKKAQLNEYVDSNGMILDSNIGDEGGRLSGGQRQRIGIARALLTNPKILVMDEATSALDAQTEENISNTIGKIKQDSLVIVVAHRLATARKADLVIYMEDGQIKAQGTFDQVRSLVPNFDTQAQLMGL